MPGAFTDKHKGYAFLFLFTTRVQSRSNSVHIIGKKEVIYSGIKQSVRGTPSTNT